MADSRSSKPLINHDKFDDYFSNLYGRNQPERACRVLPRLRPIVQAMSLSLITSIFTPHAFAQISYTGDVSPVPPLGQSIWNVGEILTVGLNGVATLSVSNAASINSSAGQIGRGNVTINGPNASWTNTGAVFIFDEGTLNIINGGQVSSSYGSITGAVNVSGSDSKWNAGSLPMTLSKGSLQITDGGSVTSGHAQILDSHSSILVGGANSILNVNGNITLGGTVPGDPVSMSINDGGRVVANDISLSSGSTGQHTINFNLAGTDNARGILEVGRFRVEAIRAAITIDGGIVRAREDQSDFFTASSGRIVLSGEGLFFDTNTYDVGIDTSVLGGQGRLTKLGDGNLTLTGIYSSLSAVGVAQGMLIIDSQINSNLSVDINYTGIDPDTHAEMLVKGSNALLSSSAMYAGSSGRGALRVIDGGTASGTYGYIGNDVAGVGSVLVRGAGSTWSASNAVFIGNEGKGTLTIDDGGTVVSGVTWVAKQSGSTGELNLVGTTGAHGMLETDQLIKGDGSATVELDGGGFRMRSQVAQFFRDFGAGNIALGANGGIFDTNGFDLNVSSSIFTGSGGLIKEGMGTLTLTDTSHFTGDTIVNAGKLSVNGNLLGGFTINDGGILSGTGTVGDLNVVSGGTLNPGNSIGTLMVNGNLTFASGAIYQVEADATGNSDQVVVNGTATLNGNVVALPESGGTYRANTAYTILTSSNALIGQFNSSVSSSLAFLNASLSQDTNNVYLNLRRNDIAYADVAQTRNQRNVANALQNSFTAGDGSADMDTVVTAVNNLSADNARAAFESMNGAGLVSLRRASTNFTGNFGNQLMGRLQSAGMGSTAQSINGMQLAANDRLGDLMPALAQNTRSDVPASNNFSLGGGVPTDDGKRGFWLRGFGFDQDTDGDGNAAGSRIKGIGITGGFDTRVRSDLVVGVAFSHATSDVRATFSETGKSRGNAAAVYASYASGPWNVNGNLMLAHNANRMNRDIIVGAISRTAKARFDSKTLAAYGEVSYDLPQTSWTLQPLAGLGVTHNRNDGFTETGADSMNIQANAQNITSTRTLFGARALFDLNGIHVQPRAIWAHEFGDINKGLTAQLQGSPAAAFTTYGVDLPRDSFITGVTVAGRSRDGMSLFADVQGEFNSKQTGVALLVGLRKSW